MHMYKMIQVLLALSLSLIVGQQLQDDLDIKPLSCPANSECHDQRMESLRVS